MRLNRTNKENDEDEKNNEEDEKEEKEVEEEEEEEDEEKGKSKIKQKKQNQKNKKKEKEKEEEEEEEEIEENQEENEIYNINENTTYKEFVKDISDKYKEYKYTKSIIQFGLSLKPKHIESIDLNPNINNKIIIEIEKETSDEEKKGATYKKYPIALLTHEADLEATYFYDT